MAGADLDSIYGALLSGEPTAPRDLVNACVGPLFGIIRHRFPVLPAEAQQDAVHDALLALIADPTRYRPEKGSVLNYLAQVAAHKALDQLRALRRRQPESAVGGAVELDRASANNPSRTDVEFEVQSRMVDAEVEALVREILPDDRDRRVWEMGLDGRTPTQEYAAALDLVHLPPEEQAREVKRHRDRIWKRIQRRRDEFRRLL